MTYLNLLTGPVAHGWDPNVLGAEYPAEHNVGHEYYAKPSLLNFYKKLDPTNALNPGIGLTSKRKYWK